METFSWWSHHKVRMELLMTFEDQSEKQYKVMPRIGVLPLNRVKTGFKNATCYVAPDVLVAKKDHFINEGCLGPPEIVVEILTEKMSQSYLARKWKLYKSSGVLVCLLVLPGQKVWVLDSDEGIAAYTKGIVHVRDYVLDFDVIFSDREYELKSKYRRE